MSFWETLKHRRLLVLYGVCTIIILLFCLQRLDILDSQLSEKIITFEEFKVYGFVPSNLVVLIPLTYIVAMGFLIVKYKEYKNHVIRYQSFEDYSVEFQEKTLSNIFCEECKDYQSMDFKEEKMIDGMRWIYATCQKCNAANKKRLT